MTNKKEVETTGNSSQLSSGLLGQLKELAMRTHYECEDPWYSCPKSREGTINDCKGDECDCGTEKHNEKVEEICRLLTETLA